MECRKFIFLILNVAITLVFFAILTVGGLGQEFTETAATVMAKDSYCDKDVHQDYSARIYVFKMHNQQEFKRAGARLITLSVFVLGVAVLGWIVVGSDKKRPKLAFRGRLVYMVCLAVLTAAQFGVCSDFMEWFAKIPTRMEHYFNLTSGSSDCLRLVSCEVTKNLTIFAVVTIAILLLQISQVIIGVLIIRENHEAKVTPDLTVTSSSNGPDFTMNHVTNPANQPKEIPPAGQPGLSDDTQEDSQKAGKDENEAGTKSSRKSKKKISSMKKKKSPPQQLVEQPGTSRETPRESHVTEKETHVTERSDPAMLPEPQSTDTRPCTPPGTSAPPPLDPVRVGARSPDAGSLDLQTYKESFNGTEHNWGSGNIWDQFGT